MTDERYKQLMEQVGMPNSRSLLVALKQVANEVEQEVTKNITQKSKLPSLEDVIKDLRHSFNDTDIIEFYNYIKNKLCED